MDELQLWTSFRKGDASALSAIFHTHIQSLYGYGKRFSTDAQLVEDAIQDVFLTLWQRREHIGETDSVKRYLMGAVRRQVLRKLKGLKTVDAAIEIENYDFEVEFTIEHQWVLDELSEEKRIRVNEALTKLSHRQKEIIQLKFYEGFDHQKIAEIMGISYQSVRNLLHTAIKKLQKALMILVTLFLLKISVIVYIFFN